MNAFQEAVANDLDKYRIRFERADHALRLRFDHARRTLVLRWANAVVRYPAGGLATL